MCSKDYFKTTIMSDPTSRPTPIASLISLVSDKNDAAIEKMKVGAYEKANFILIDALNILETFGCTSARPVDPLINPLHFPVSSSSCHATTLLNSRTSSFETPCTVETALSSVLTTLPTASNSSNNNNVSFFLNAARRQQQRLTVRLPEPQNAGQHQTAIYNRAFLIHKDQSRPNPRIAAAVLTYNAALCAHLHAVLTGNSSVSPHRALCLYSTAYWSVLTEQQQQTLDWLLQVDSNDNDNNIHSNNNNNHNNNYGRTMILMQAALCHNMAAIHGDSFWNFAHARLLRCQLAAVIHWTAFSQMETDDCK